MPRGFGPLRRAALAAVAGGIAIALCQPGYGLWPFAFVCLVPLLRAIDGQGVGRRLVVGWLAGTVAATLVTGRPVSAALVAYFDLAPPLAWLAAAAVTQLFGALPFAVFTLLAGDLRDSHRGLLPVRIGIAWAAGELVRGTLFGGLPWGHLAYGVLAFPTLLQGASLVGVLGVSVWLAACNAVLALGRRRGAAAGLAWVGALTLALLGGGQAAVPQRAGPGSVHVAPQPGATHVRLVQPGASPDAASGVRQAVRDVERLVALSQGARADLAIWPENAVSALLPYNDQLLVRAAEPPLAWTRQLLLGAPTVDAVDRSKLRNSVLLLDDALALRAGYDKLRLFPFSERLPWPFSLLGSTGLEVAPGSELATLPAGEALRLGPLVCYEILFGAHARELVGAGADVLVNLSNDSWFGTTRALDQHQAAAILRAIEVRRPVLRSTSTGVTAAIDARGVTVAQLAAQEPGAVDVWVRPGTGRSLYARIGDAPLWAGLAWVLGLVLRDALGRRRG